MKLYFSLNKPLECGYICSQINKLVQKYGNKEHILLIEIKETSEYIETPKIEYKDSV